MKKVVCLDIDFPNIKALTTISENKSPVDTSKNCLEKLQKKPNKENCHIKLTLIEEKYEL
ncbi:24521_t:CDS:2 [Gigaspora rosea]|nr:24521_t:CDS:2 [Gigaspora rosea]